MMKRILLLVLALLTVLSATSCGRITQLVGGTQESTPASEESVSPAPQESKEQSDSDAAVSAPSILDIPEDARYTATVLTVGDVKISYGLYRYYYRNIADSMAGEDGDYFKNNPDKLAELEERAIEQCKVVASYYLMAQKAGYTLPDEKELEEAFVEYVKTYEPMYPLYYGVSLADYLKQSYMTLSTYKTMFVVNEYLGEPIYNYLSDEKNGMLDLSQQALEKALEEYRCVKHILVGYSDGLKDEEALALARDLAKQLREGGDIDALMKEYSNDYQQDGQNAYTFTYGEMVKEFEDTAFSMEVGQVSDPVKSTYGYHVIVRLEIDKEAFEKAQFKEIAVSNAFTAFVEGQNGTLLEAFEEQCTYEKLMAD